MIEQEEKRVAKYNSAMYFILPMLQLNKSSFGVDNFINSYVDKSGYIIVDLYSEPLMSTNGVLHDNYITDFNVEGGVRFVYGVPEEFLPDLKRFEEGRYSQFSSALKVAISKYSNLKQDNIHIKCLNPQLSDRQRIADDLGVKVDLIKELKSAPADCNFIKIK